MKNWMESGARHSSRNFTVVGASTSVHQNNDSLDRLSGHRLSDDPSSDPAQELEELRVSLAKSQRQTHAAKIVIRRLEEVNSHLARELARLEQNEAKALALACYDELTGLPNRRLLRDRLRQAIAQGIRQDKQVALLLVDLDGFKTVNDRLGHSAGDRLLQAVAKRLTDSIRAADTACRYGGDEFVIMLPAVDHPALATAVATKVRQRLAEPYDIDGHEIRMTGSVGAVFCPEDGRGYDELLKKADRALYRAKARSRNVSILPLRDGIGAGASVVEHLSVPASSE